MKKIKLWEVKWQITSHPWDLWQMPETEALNPTTPSESLSFKDNTAFHSKKLVFWCNLGLEFVCSALCKFYSLEKTQLFVAARTEKGDTFLPSSGGCQGESVQRCNQGDAWAWLQGNLPLWLTWLLKLCKGRISASKYRRKGTTSKIVRLSSKQSPDIPELTTSRPPASEILHNDLQEQSFERKCHYPFLSLCYLCKHCSI